MTALPLKKYKLWEQPPATMASHPIAFTLSKITQKSMAIFKHRIACEQGSAMTGVVFSRGRANKNTLYVVYRCIWGKFKGFCGVPFTSAEDEIYARGYSAPRM